MNNLHDDAADVGYAISSLRGGPDLGLKFCIDDCPPSSIEGIGAAMKKADELDRPVVEEARRDQAFTA